MSVLSGLMLQLYENVWTSVISHVGRLPQPGMNTELLCGLAWVWPLISRSVACLCPAPGVSSPQN